MDMTLGLPMTEEEFTAKQASFLGAVAETARVEVADVQVVGIEELPFPQGGTGVNVKVEVKSKNQATGADIASAWDMAVLNAELEKEGMPEATAVSKLTVETEHPAQLGGAEVGVTGEGGCGVETVLGFAMSKDEFTPEKEESVKRAVAAAAKVAEAHVAVQVVGLEGSAGIAGVEGGEVERSGAEEHLGISVVATVASADEAASTGIVSGWDAAALEAELAKEGLPEASVVSEPVSSCPGGVPLAGEGEGGQVVEGGEGEGVSEGVLPEAAVEGSVLPPGEEVVPPGGEVVPPVEGELVTPEGGLAPPAEGEKVEGGEEEHGGAKKKKVGGV
jgi:hypothetical protein